MASPKCLLEGLIQGPAVGRRAKLMNKWNSTQEETINKELEEIFLLLYPGL